jgi:hypothetical protein
MKKPQKINYFIPVKPNIARMMKFWKSQSSENDKGGSFNLTLYLDYLNVISQQPIESVSNRIKTR